jgi:hypothetical protein
MPISVLCRRLQQSQSIIRARRVTDAPETQKSQKTPLLSTPGTT